MPDGRTPAPLPADAVAALARQVERLETKVDGLSGLADIVVGLANEVAELAHASAGGEETAPSWLWPAEPRTGEEAASLLAQLIRWAGRVHLRYDGAALPECWLWHPDVVEELMWLRAAWHVAYHGDGASAQRAGDWHDRQRPGVVRRIRAAAGSCSLREHFEPASLPAVPIADAAATIAQWSVDQTRPAPVPTTEHLRAADSALRSVGGARR